MQFYSLHHPRREWGDYSDVLFDGDASRDAESGLLQVIRTGPFVPPIAFPCLGATAIVTGQFRLELESSGLTGFTFRPAVKKHIVRLEWDKWNLQDEEPEFYLESGEPEDYLVGEHSPETAAQMPDLWELVIAETAHVERIMKAYSCVAIYLIEQSWNGDDFFCASEVGYLYVTEKAALWLEAHALGDVTFHKVATK